MTAAALTLPAKPSRTIHYALVRLRSAKSFIPFTSIDDFAKVPFGHELQLSDQRMVLLSEHGMEQVRVIVRTLHEADLFDGLADYSDLWTACWKTLEDRVSKSQLAESTHEWLEEISAQIRPGIQSRIFVVPFVGVEFKDIDALPLGSLKLLRPSVSYLDEAGVDHAFADVPKIIRRYRDRELWLTGRASGTPAVAEKRFRTLSDLVAGLLAVAVAATQTSGATRVFISANMTGHDSHGRATWFSWNESGTGFSLHGSGIRGVPFVVGADLRQQFSEASVIATAMRIFESESRTPLEEVIVRGFHWFEDAHRDPTPVMQFVKYWSCIETFFSGDQADITRSVSLGVAAVLVFGGYAFVPIEGHPGLKKRIAKLYGLRSKAIHRASRNHVTELDVGELSRCVAQLLLNMVSFVERGYRTSDEIKRHCEHLDKQVQQGSD